jgi:hypothetical protein
MRRHVQQASSYTTRSDSRNTLPSSAELEQTHCDKEEDAKVFFAVGRVHSGARLRVALTRIPLVVHQASCRWPASAASSSDLRRAGWVVGTFGRLPISGATLDRGPWDRSCPGAAVRSARSESPSRGSSCERIVKFLRTGRQARTLDRM